MKKEIIIFTIVFSLFLIAIAILVFSYKSNVPDEPPSLTSEEAVAARSLEINIDDGISPQEKEEIDNYIQERKGTSAAGGSGGGGGSGSTGISSTIEEPPVAQCNSTSYIGECSVSSISQTYASIHQVLLGFGLNPNETDQGFEVLFEYSSPLAGDLSAGVKTFLIKEVIYPNQRYLDKYDLFVGKAINCTVVPTIQGECAAKEFILEGIDKNDDSTFDYSWQ